ncbi:YeeE/YedE family protein [Methylobacterium sp. C25]|uniref:YeeE/YedE family protein n=1 Tax=Methylobacterium sp. C25 TaxID=2721622 RepID=UPI001F2CEF1C|nr:YeeE/YedE family protein [Methylobacterium sp. C25]MCE4226490.1 YeeE/YedE family protein [Methylobacterium sp. C25]
MEPHLVRAVLGLLIGSVLGYAARRGGFCTLGALEDAVYGKDTRRLRAWALAIAVAMVGVHILNLEGLELHRTLYASPQLELGPLVLGGLTFGFGMALVGNCAFGNLLRLGGGDLKALVTLLVAAVSAVMAMRGLTALVRVVAIDPLSIPMPDGRFQLLPDLLGVGRTASMMFAIACACLLTIYALADGALRKDRKLTAAAVAIGLCVTAGWWATGFAGFDSFGTDRPVSLSFARPVGDTMLFAMLASGMQVDFGIASVMGVLLGAFVEARQARHFRWEAPDDASELRRHIFGAFLMGTGGITALGCTIGQGVTGIATLSIGSAIALASIAAGGRAGLYYLVEWRG